MKLLVLVFKLLIRLSPVSYIQRSCTDFTMNKKKEKRNSLQKKAQLHVFSSELYHKIASGLLT